MAGISPFEDERQEDVKPEERKIGPSILPKPYSLIASIIQPSAPNRYDRGMGPYSTEALLT